MNNQNSKTMKKSLIALLMVAICAISAQARDEISRDVTILPKAAQSFLKSNFKAPVSFIKIDKTLGHVNDYEVVLTDGVEIDFDNDGSWDKIETPADLSVPTSIIPKVITAYVAKNFPGQNIVSIEKERRTYEVELRNGVDLIFDRSGNFKRIDDWKKSPILLQNRKISRNFAIALGAVQWLLGTYDCLMV